jgi:hypothetical protein
VLFTVAETTWLLIGVLVSLSVAFGQGGGQGQISGRVEDPLSTLVANASVTLLSLNRVVQTRSRSDGTFEFAGLEPGVYAVEITAPGFTKKTVPVTLQPDHLQEVISSVVTVGNMPDMERCGREVSVRYEAVIPSRADLSGTLRDYFSRKPVRDAEITMAGKFHGLTPVVVRSDPHGRFSVPHLTPDFYDLRISRNGYENEELKTVAMPQKNQVLIESTLRKRTQLVACQ